IENKLEDALKNQMITDDMVNKLTLKIDKFSELLSNSKLPLIKNNSYSSSSNSYNYSNGSSYDNSRRGPGRPRKDGSPALFDKFNNDSSLKSLLPIGSMQISKSKRYFIDPKEKMDIALKQKKSMTASEYSASLEKRRRGRPPKKRTVDTVIINFDHEDDTEDLPSDSNNSEGIEEDYLDANNDIIDSSNATPNPSGIKNISVNDNISSSPPSDNSLVNGDKLKLHDEDAGSDLNSRQERELNKRRDDREKMLVNLKYNDRDKAKSFMESNKKLLQAMKDEEKRKKLSQTSQEDVSSQSTVITQVSTPFYPSSNVVSAHANDETEDELKNKNSTMASETPILNSDDSQPLSQFHISNGEKSDVTVKHEPPSLKRTRSNEDDDESVIIEEDMDDSKLDGSQSHRHLRKRRATIERDDESSVVAAGSKVANTSTDSKSTLLSDNPIELVSKGGLFYRRDDMSNPITIGEYLEFKFRDKEEELTKAHSGDSAYIEFTKQDRMNAHFFKPAIELETENAYQILSNTILTEKYVNSLEFFLMEFRWENKLVGLGMKLRESKRTWQRRKALFALFEFWRDQSREKRNFKNFTILHAVKEMESYRIFINRSVSWFYNHITLLKMILYDLCDNIETHWREWMFPRDKPIPAIGIDGVEPSNINRTIDNILTLEFLEDNNDGKDDKKLS
ncbi:hypothetical protein Kpol_1005p6, partial [Vanderwaltozyma polyspora DSM 70294]